LETFTERRSADKPSGFCRQAPGPTAAVSRRVSEDVWSCCPYTPGEFDSLHTQSLSRPNGAHHIAVRSIDGGSETFRRSCRGPTGSSRSATRGRPRSQEMFTIYGAKRANLGQYGITYGVSYPNCPANGFCFRPLVTNLWFAGRLVSKTGAGSIPPRVFQGRLGTNRATGLYLSLRRRPGGDGQHSVGDVYAGFVYGDRLCGSPCRTTLPNRKLKSQATCDQRQ
jgi:hypothetical protein